ncbi:hypothetical protein Hanom_Chr10g00943351 [Helianthus anomalus]
MHQVTQWQPFLVPCPYDFSFSCSLSHVSWVFFQGLYPFPCFYICCCRRPYPYQ